MRDTIWVVITDGATARICSSEDGVTTLIPTLDPVETFADGVEAWQSAERPVWNARPAAGRRKFATELARVLHDGASDDAYDGLIVIAAPRIMGELRQALAPETRRRLIGEIVRDLPDVCGAKKPVGKTWH
jgi:protein required for attachment to host cells